MTYTQALRFLNSFVNYERKNSYTYAYRFRLTRIEKLLALLGAPHKRLKTILIGGTNGKGSTVTILGCILSDASYCVGTYTSPHLRDIRERICIDKRPISKSQFADGLRTIQHTLRTKWHAKTCGGTLTYFEILTVLALVHFARGEVDVAILEVGLGGRLDATNVVSPLFSIITSIGHDHQQLLGPTLTHIAREKAGIIKKDSWIISARQKRSARAVLTQVAHKQNARLLLYKRDFAPARARLTHKGWTFNFNEYHNLMLPLPGTFQLENVSLAFEALRLLRDYFSFDICDGRMRRSLRNIVWPGRCEIVRGRPPILLDGAHNEEAMRALGASVRSLFPQKEIIIICAVSQDKKSDVLLRELAKFSNTIIVTKSEHPRACRIEALKRKAASYFKEVIAMLNMKEAYAYAQRVSHKRSLIVVTGSLFLVAEARCLLRRPI